MLSANGWGLTKFKKYQMKKIEKTFFKFCLSPCYTLLFFLNFFFGGVRWLFNFKTINYANN